MIPIKMPKEEREEMLRYIQTYFETERGEEIGMLAAESLLDFISSKMGTFYYNKGVQDARTVLRERFAALEDELYSLERPIR